MFSVGGLYTSNPHTNFVAGFNKAYSENVVFFHLFSSFGCSVDVTANRRLPRKQHTRVSLDLSDTGISFAICREHDGFLSTFKSVCVFLLLFLFVSVIEWCLIIELTQL